MHSCIFQTKLSNFVSVNIEASAAEGQISKLNAANSYSTVREKERVVPVSSSSVESAQFPAEAIHGITGVNDARQFLKLTGKGINVAVIDTGVYYRHPALGGGFGPGCKVSKGYDFAGDAYDGYTIPQPDEDPIDNCSDSSHGTGTHVAGIVAADARNITTPGFIPSSPFTGV
ncbi:UNVERIFIED_CONTAM: hypothetical protein HDU68_001961, partial [Siphonaria sp. JEL0065]